MSVQCLNSTLAKKCILNVPTRGLLVKRTVTPRCEQVLTNSQRAVPHMV